MGAKEHIPEDVLAIWGRFWWTTDVILDMNWVANATPVPDALEKK